MSGHYRDCVVGCWLFGKRLVTMPWLVARGKVHQSAKYSPPCTKQFGLLVSKRFRDEYKPKAKWIDRLCSIAGSKWTTLNESDYDMWKKDRKLKDRCVAISSLVDLHQFAKRVSVVDARNSDNMYVK